MKVIVKLLAVLLLALYAQAAFAPPPPNEITSCGFSTSSSGTYLVTQNLTNTSGNCISILDAANVTLDCQGYRLKGTGSGDGIWVTNNSTGVVIRNCDIYSFLHGIHYRGDGGIVEYNKVVDNTHGIRLSQGSHNDVRWNTGNDNHYGMYVDLSANNNVYENTFHRSQNGIHCNRGTGNYFIGNQLNLNNANGVFFYSCSSNSLWYNNANLNTTGFFNRYTAHENDVYKNVFNRNSYRGISDGQGSDTTNTYEGNVCKNNGNADSVPAGLCK